MVDGGFLVSLTLEVFRRQSMKGVAPLRFETPAQEAVENVVVAQRAVCRFDDEQILPLQVRQHGSGIGHSSSGRQAQRVAGSGAQLAQDGRDQQKLAHVRRLAFEHLLRQHIEQHVQRLRPLPERKSKRHWSLPLPADVLPDQLQGNRPAFGVRRHGLDFLAAQFQPVMHRKEVSNFISGEIQQGLLDLQHFSPHPQPGEGRQVDGRASRKQDMDVCRSKRDQPVHNVDDLATAQHQMDIIEHQQERRFQMQAEGIDQVVHDVTPGKRALRAVPCFEGRYGDAGKVREDAQDGIAEMQQEDRRVVVVLMHLIPGHIPHLADQFCQSGALSVALPCLQDGQAVV